MERLYVVVRADLEPGAQLAQTGHAVSAFAVEHPEQHRQWHRLGQNIIVLAAAGLAEAEAILERLRGAGYAPCPFYEPDFSDELTAFAVADAGRPLSSLPKALRAPRAA